MYYMSFTNVNLLKFVPSYIMQEEAVDNRIERLEFDGRFPTFQLLALISICVIIASLLKPIIDPMPKSGN